jgi:DNA polymerase III sliding clamp (beta) subunit (PCNA family)
MQISKDLKLHKACSNDDLRPALAGVYYDGKQLVATNGHILVKVKLPKDEQGKLKNPKIIPGKVFQEICKGKKSEMGEFEIKGDKVNINSNGSSQTFDCIKEEYPDFDKVLPEKKKPVFKLCFNVDLLKDLASALGSYNGNVTLTFTNDNLNECNGYLTSTAPIPVKVDAWGGPEAEAILMPVRENS